MENKALLAPYEQYFTRSLDEVYADLETYAQLLRKWQPVQNLVSRETLDHLWTRHFVDSLQVLRLLKPSDREFLDFGSGGGFPALPLAIALKGEKHHFTLVEPISRKVSFLRTVAREVKLNANSLLTRSDHMLPESVPRPDVITSRALASLPQLCSWMAPFFAPQTRAILHKGREHVEELAETVPSWDFNVLLTKSDTDPLGVLLTLTDLRAKIKA
ncbi:16S rRNA (guanine(527)-N(7))-methyltransferase RsmG [Devosia submarina]|uniref:16S rRNA (guanine(527)-N(7))-methyltransferase RsmG n=1 Tax=Devosia submarina TaxID=1173082 RepID=UPI000D39C737|nr:16S rRNA (guanine(527)-N(7))-methyltransferase RsmG [Devosia submarina]